uniref:Uncharacterized protein n=1 Tax=Nelumbo nucifera TaxID=4432 RepID=A0A822YDS7_NELNU|nr:TPA_asm: hypothetical protein HUJ06_030593 [Nelumbo nucifera]
MLIDLQMAPCTENNLNVERSIHLTLESEMNQEEILWQQKSRIQWLKDGDRNTLFFHQTTINKCRSNRIYKLMDSEGNWLSTPQEIEHHVINFYASIYQSTSPTSNAFDLSFIQKMVTP